MKTNESLAEKLGESLTRALRNYSRVIWLVSGGSNVPISAAASQLIAPELAKKLVVMQTDERFVAPDSPDCNWRQLQDAGFGPGRAETYPVLSGGSDSMQAAATRYSGIVERQFEQADFIFGQFGIGADGHTAGIKPGSPAINASGLATAYQWDDFRRVTITFPAIERIDAAAVFAFGSDKKQALTDTRNRQTRPDDVPAAALRQINDVTVYNDQVEGAEA